MAKQTDLKNRSRIRTLLTRTLSEEISSAARESGLSKSILISQAIQDGIDNFNPAEAEGCRCYRFDAWIPTELKDRVRLLASVSGRSQQSILRYIISRYVKDGRWKNRGEGTQATSPAEGSQ